MYHLDIRKALNQLRDRYIACT